MSSALEAHNQGTKGGQDPLLSPYIVELRGGGAMGFIPRPLEAASGGDLEEAWSQV